MTSLCNATRVQYLVLFLHVSKPCPYTQNCFKVTGFGVRGKKDITWKIVELKLGTWLQWQCTRRLRFFSIWLYQEEKKKCFITLLPNLKFMPPTCICISHVMMDKKCMYVLQWGVKVYWEYYSWWGTTSTPHYVTLVTGIGIWKSGVSSC